MGTPLEVRAAAVAGQFYPRDPGELACTLQAMLAEAAEVRVWSGTPKALLVPHAGYIYSGPVAASAYACLRPLRNTFQRVVVLGPAHHVAFPGLALPGVAHFDTPLGRIPLDPAATDHLRGLPQVKVSAAAHAREHAIEVQLPFLQQTLGTFQLVPLVVGQADPEAVAQLLEALWGGPETLLVVSSDLSHYLPYELAQNLDHRTCERIADLEPLPHPEQACGATAVNGLLLAARRRGLKAHLLDLRNSGDTAGDRGRVVGYAAFAFTEDAGHGP